MSFKDVRFLTPLPPDELSKGEEQTMKDWPDDSDNDVDIESEELVIGKPIMTRSGIQIKVWTRFDVYICAKW